MIHLEFISQQSNPIEHFHLPPGMLTRTRNAHYVAFLAVGSKNLITKNLVDVIERIFSLKLPNVEWGTVNGESITITRVGANLVNAFRDRQLCRENIFDQVSRGVAQLHANGFALSDVDDGEHAFLGDLEYCCGRDSKPRSDTRRADDRATTAEELDNIQLAKLKDDLASL